MTKMYFIGLVKQVSRFLGSVLAGAVMFLGLLLVTVGLDAASAALAGSMTDGFISQGLLVASRILFVADVSLLVWWLVYSFITSVKDAKHRR